MSFIQKIFKRHVRFVIFTITFITPMDNGENLAWFCLHLCFPCPVVDVSSRRVNKRSIARAQRPSTGSNVVLWQYVIIRKSHSKSPHFQSANGKEENDALCIFEQPHATYRERYVGIRSSWRKLTLGASVFNLFHRCYVNDTKIYRFQRWKYAVNIEQLR